MKKDKNEQVQTEAAPPTPRQEVVEKLHEVVERPQNYHGCRIRDLTVDTRATDWPTSLDRAEPSQRAAVFNAGNPADVRIELGGSVCFRAHHWLMYAEERHDEESGELRTFATLVLFNAEGKTFKTTSQFAPRRLKAALELYSPEDWQRGVTFVVTDRASRMPGRHYHDIRIAVDQEPAREG
jgi:hypothetical protein